MRPGWRGEWRMPLTLLHDEIWHTEHIATKGVLLANRPYPVIWNSDQTFPRYLLTNRRTGIQGTTTPSSEAAITTSRLNGITLAVPYISDRCREACILLSTLGPGSEVMIPHMCLRRQRLSQHPTLLIFKTIFRHFLEWYGGSWVNEEG